MKNKKIYVDYNSSKEAYLNYIREHKENVKKCWNKLQIDFVNFPFVKDKYINYYITNLIDKHDNSKYNDVEFEPYRKYFYPTKDEIDEAIIQSEYDNAWIHHYSNNPHHWEYWLEFDKNKERECLRFIREAFIVERICDWMAMSLYNNGSTIEWYNNNKDTMYLPDNDKIYLENILYNIKE